MSTGGPSFLSLSPVRPSRGGLFAALLIVLSLVVTHPGFRNRFVQDDLPLIDRNERVHTLAHPAGFFTLPYWHDPFPPAMYRPFATATLAVQWTAGAGSPAAFRWTSAVLLAASAVALFGLAARLIPVGFAWVAAAGFAVHPVHVEATALGVNQGEIAVALLLALAVALYLRDRLSGSLRRSAIAGISAAYLAAALFKEHGLVLPGLLLAAELTVIRDPAEPRRRIGALRPFYLWLVLLAAMVVAARTAVLGGGIAGTFTADAFVGRSLGSRLLTMLAVVPEWWRLLLWPAHLQADYGPNEIPLATGFGTPQLAGVVLLALWFGAIAGCRRRLPVVAFGLCWVGVALLPVSNVLLPTGIVLAERTLFLASAGAMLAVGGCLAALWRIAQPRPRTVVAAAVAILLALGALASRERALVWRDQRTLLNQTVLDAPESYAAHLALARFLEDSGSAESAASRFRRAAELRPELVGLERSLADQYRMEGFCRTAARHYRRVLAVTPDDSATRRSLNACMLAPPNPVP